ncbi:MAG: NADH-quinone oxidoreductase subunit NuoE [Rhodospirillaceae bacterium]|nr:NADH-quinone oxidoreductase subunit NuoE [Rhodospirillaceae bacterium]MBT4425719.1 NADH-quinone oxidoreductase subunit NuoE [Rhodospirillaceae bacterium]MBT5674521.1 NADH-quinone oxidoreductase subunit NuoE [Rhodospirillaceae bacterium]MBT5779055.1 NADH-quinone oxidoreductase subunit NuoE [Rhodospirillaceae bacterium]MBT6830150.1 NADH-quinone oxidoreductase subunit NuoE [Rhodospirillaceae bacterium]
MNAGSKNFVFSPENMVRAKAHMAKYPEGRQASAVLALLDLAQRQNGGWVSREAMAHIAELLDMAEIRVYEVATFYTMVNLQPVGKYLIQLCRTTPCWLCGSDDLRNVCKDVLGIGVGESTEDGMFTLIEVECLGACVNAPMAQINDDFYEDLSAARMKEILEMLRRGEQPPTGSQTGRQTSAPATGATTLTDAGNA